MLNKNEVAQKRLVKKIRRIIIRSPTEATDSSF
jgi:hypothetical protein